MQIPILYVKNNCPWCIDAINYFATENIKVKLKDVLEDKSAYHEMIEISGQNYTPTFVYKDCIISDFSIDEFKNSIKNHKELLIEFGINL